MSKGDPKETPSEQFVWRVVYSLFKPAMHFADRYTLPLKGITQLSQLAIIERKRARALPIREIAAQLDTSSRTIDRLMAELREDFFEPEQQHELPRRIEFMLWTKPLSLARLIQLMPEHDPDEIEKTLERLIEQRRVIVEEGRTTTYATTQRANRLPDDTESAKIDALNHLLQIIEQAVQRRFFGKDPRAAARNASLRVRAQDIHELELLYEQHIWPKLVELDAKASEDDNAIEIGWLTCWSPMQNIEDEEERG